MLTFETKTKVKLFNETSLPVGGVFTIESFNTEISSVYSEFDNATESFKFVLADVGSLNGLIINRSIESCEIFSMEGFFGDAFSLFKKIILGIVTVFKQFFLAIISFFRNVGIFFKNIFTNKMGENNRKIYEVFQRAKYNNDGKSAFDELSKLQVTYVAPFERLNSIFITLGSMSIFAKNNSSRIYAFINFVLNTIKTHVENPSDFIERSNSKINILASIKAFNGNIENMVKYMNQEVVFDMEAENKNRNYFDVEYTTMTNTPILMKNVNKLIEDETPTFILVKPKNIDSPDVKLFNLVYHEDAIPKAVTTKFFDYVKSANLNDIIDDFNGMIININSNALTVYKDVDKMHRESTEILNVAVPTLTKFGNIVDELSKYKKTDNTELSEEESTSRSEIFNMIVALFKCYTNNLTSSIYVMRSQHSLTLAIYTMYTTHINEFNNISTTLAEIIKRNVDK